jgi:hypothetical protein
LASNGRLPSSQLKAIPGGRLQKGTAYSWLRLRAKIARVTKGRVWICPTSPRTAYRTYAEQQYFWNLYISGRGNLAARPGTSNHGWGLAVDVPTVEMAQLINKYGASYGWQKRWSDAPSEWWHFKYADGQDRHKGERPISLKPDAEYLTKREATARRILLRERRIAKRNGGWAAISPAHLSKAKKAKDDLRKYRKVVKDQARKTGWKKNHRKERYDAMGRALRG